MDTRAIYAELGLHTFGGYTSANLDIRFFHDDEALDGSTTSATVFSSEHPFAVCFSQTFNWDDTDPRLIVTAVTWSEAYTPSGLFQLATGAADRRGDATYSQLHISLFVLLHSITSLNCVFSINHLNESMTFVIVDDASLDNAITTEKLAQVGFRTAIATLALYSRY